MLVREKDLFSVSSLFLISSDVFVFQISNFHDTILAVDSERPVRGTRTVKKKGEEN